MSRPRIDTAVILAAGMGKRLLPFTLEHPKCLAPVCGQPMLLNALRQLDKIGIRRTIVVAGHLAGQVKQAVMDFGVHNPMELEVIENIYYAATNNCYSLWLTRDILPHGVLLIEGDVYFNRRISAQLQEAMSHSTFSYWLVRPAASEDRGCLITAKPDGELAALQIADSPLPAKVHPQIWKSLGMLLLTPQLGLALSGWLDEAITCGQVNLFYDLILGQHLEEQTIYLLNSAPEACFEIDTMAELKEAEQRLMRAKLSQGVL